LYDSAGDGNQVGGDVNVPDVDVIDGYFTVALDFGSSVFEGDARWLKIGVRPGELEDPNGYTPLSPRQEATPVPYAIHAGSDNDWMVDGNDMYSIPDGNVGIGTTNPLSKLSVGGDGFANTGVYGQGSVYGVEGKDSETNSYGLLGYDIYGVYGSGTAGVKGVGTTGQGVYGTSETSAGVFGEANSVGVWGRDSDTLTYGRLGFNAFGGYFVGDGYFSGNVGIGANPPSAKLEVAGQVKITGGSPGAGKVLTSIDASGLGSWQNLSVNDADSDPSNELNTSLVLNGNNLELTDNGGVLTTSLSGLVDDGDWTISDSNLYSAVAGNVGIGVTNPLKNKLHVVRPSGDYGPGRSTIYGRRNGSGGVEANGGTAWSLNGVDAAVKGYSSVGNNYTAGVAGYNFMDYPQSAGVIGAINAGNIRGMLGYNDASSKVWGGYFKGDGYFSGDVGIGTTSPDAKLEVDGGAIKATGGLIIETRTGSDPPSPVTGQIWLRTDIP
ncbi:MAG: hypothetical protein ACYS21_17855, partial [Planctomycetota bacterium]